jgi:hypothetical protein
LFREEVHRLSGIKASLTFPYFSAASTSSLEFSLSFSEDKKHFTLDGVEVRKENKEKVIRVVGRKVFELSQRAYRDPSMFLRPDLELLDKQLQDLVERVEEKGLDEAISREIVIKATLLDFYEALAKLTFSLSDQITRFLEESQVVNLTIPRILLAYLNQVLESKNLDELLLSGLEAGR